SSTPKVGRIARAAVQNNRLSKSRPTRFDAVGRLILDGKCDALSPIVPMKPGTRCRMSLPCRASCDLRCPSVSRRTSMKAYTIAHIPGDGIGKDVTEAGWEVLQAAAKRGGFALHHTKFPWSCAYYLETGAMMPPDGV